MSSTHFSRAAPVHIFVFCNASDVKIEKEWEETQILWSIQWISTACQNVLLAARALNLGSLWIGLTLSVEEEIKRLLEVPEDVRLMTVIAIGYPADEPLPRLRKPLSEVRFFEKWKSD